MVDSLLTEDQFVTVSFFSKCKTDNGKLAIRVKTGLGLDVVNVEQAITGDLARYVFSGILPHATTRLVLILQGDDGISVHHLGISVHHLQMELGARPPEAGSGNSGSST